MIATEDYLRELVTIVFAQKRVIARVTIAIFILGILVAFFWPPTYAAEGSILVRGKKVDKSPEALETTQARAPELTEKDLASEVELMTSPTVLMKTIQVMAAQNKYFTRNDLDADELRKNVTKMQEQIRTKIVQDSNVIKINFFDKDPERAYHILDQLIQQYIIFRSGVYTPGQAEDFFAKQTKTADDNLRKVEERLVQLTNKFSTASPAKEIENNLWIKKDLEQQLDQLTNEYLGKKELAEYLQTTLRKEGVQYFSFIENLSINKLGEKLLDQVVERSNLMRIYHPDSPVIQAIDESISKNYKGLKDEVTVYANNQRAQIKAIEEKMAALNQRLADITKKNVELHSYHVEYNRIQREMDLLKNSYDTFTKRWEESKIDASSGASNLFSIRVLGKPFYSDKPVFPQKLIVIPLGLLVGLITGLSLGFLREYFDHTIKKPEDITRFLGLPMIFSIPSWDEK